MIGSCTTTDLPFKQVSRPIGEKPFIADALKRRSADLGWEGGASSYRSSLGF